MLGRSRSRRLSLVEGVPLPSASFSEPESACQRIAHRRQRPIDRARPPGDRHDDVRAEHVGRLAEAPLPYDMFARRKEECIKVPFKPQMSAGFQEIGMGLHTQPRALGYQDISIGIRQ